jgi:hypothetical protein
LTRGTPASLGHHPSSVFKNTVVGTTVVRQGGAVRSLTTTLGVNRPTHRESSLGDNDICDGPGPIDVRILPSAKPFLAVKFQNYVAGLTIKPYALVFSLQLEHVDAFQIHSAEAVVPVSPDIRCAKALNFIRSPVSIEQFQEFLCSAPRRYIVSVSLPDLNKKTAATNYGEIEKNTH